MPAFNFVWRSAYHDSVTLMRLARDLESVPGVARAAAMMGTPQNRALMQDAGLLTTAAEAAGPIDLVIAVVADDETTARQAEEAVRAALSGRATASRGSSEMPRPRTLASALRAAPDANIALISIPGLYAAAEARRALRAGLHVMLFSDNVPVEQEIELKRLARERGLMLMGPDCGTAIVNGVPLGFANVVSRGRIGIAAASGTGAQEVMSTIARCGEGVSHVIGVGGRDLSDAVGGLAMEQAIDALAADPATSVVCVIGKPPGGTVARRLESQIARLGKPCALHFVGSTTASLEDCARDAVALARGEKHQPVAFTIPDAEVAHMVSEARRGRRPEQRFVRGVYSGGTLAWEARSVLDTTLGDVAPGVTGTGGGHRVVDLGEDVFTVGRPHPMIDGTVRREWIAREAADPSTAALLLDIVLGHGAHPDPAGELLPAIDAARDQASRRGGALAVVASVTGTDADPQNRSAQVSRLRGAGVVVMPSNAQAARLAARIAAR